MNTKSFLAGIVFAALLTVAVSYGIVVSGYINPGADESIPAIETWAAKSSLRAYLKQHTAAMNNPLEVNEVNLKEGSMLYLSNCAVCHGYAAGEMTSIAEGLYKKPPAFAKEDWSHDKDGLIYWFIEHGVRLTGMPAYDKTLKDKEKWQIVMFIKNMKQLPANVDNYWRSVKPLADR